MDAVSSVETADLHPAPTAFIGSSDGDYPVIKSFDDAKTICFLESQKLWGIAGPIAFNILCNYGVNSFTNIFVGHIGDLELSAVAISLSVIENFSFGFLVIDCYFIPTHHSYFSILFVVVGKATHHVSNILSFHIYKSLI